MLIPSTKLYTQEEDASDRIMLSIGSQAVKGDFYHENSFLPANEWVRMNNAELANIAADKRCFTKEHLSSSIGISKLDDAVIELCKKIGFDDFNDRRDIHKRYTEVPEVFDEFDKQVAALIERMKLHYGSEHKIHAIPIVAAGLPTITQRLLPTSEERLFCGMHIDNDSSDLIKDCVNSRNRISINLTGESRHLLYVNVSASDIILRAEALNMGDCVNLQTRDELVQAFFARNPTYPIVRVEIKPYELYVAPTDNLIHDASTVLRKREDITLVALGYFSAV